MESSDTLYICLMILSISDAEARHTYQLLENIECAYIMFNSETAENVRILFGIKCYGKI